MTSSQPIVLVVDDDPGVLGVVERVGQHEGFRVMAYTDPREALDAISETAIEIAVVDRRMPYLGGLDVLRIIRERRPQCGVILMTGEPSLDSAIEAVKLGALDYLTKPLDFSRLRQLLSQARENAARRAELLATERQTAARIGLCGMIGRSAEMQELFDLVRRIAPHARTALVFGETGTGKEGIARAIHLLGPRRQKKFVTINCSAVVDTLFESELFGHVRGAFTGATDNKAGLFEAADGGTLFLDEVGELRPAVQAKLLRVLETGEVQRVGSLQPRHVDVRVVAATNSDLHAEADAGRFRSDLLYRLNVVELRVPPLRHRREDIPYLVAAFVREFADRFGKVIDGVSPAAERMLMQAPWPGNVRELRNALERACMLSDGRTLTEADVRQALPAQTVSNAPAQRVSTSEAPESLGVDWILAAIEAEHGNKRAAAARLGISRRTLYRRLDVSAATHAASVVARRPRRTTPESQLSRPGVHD